VAVVILPGIGPRSSTLRIVNPLRRSSRRIGTYFSNGSTDFPPSATMGFIEPGGNVHGATDLRSNRRGRYDPGTIRLEQRRIVSRFRRGCPKRKLPASAQPQVLWGQMHAWVSETRIPRAHRAGRLSGAPETGLGKTRVRLAAGASGISIHTPDRARPRNRLAA
jgi:hypothetical protein